MAGDDIFNSGNSLLHDAINMTAIGAPMLAGLYVGYRNLKRNEPINNPLTGPSGLIERASGVGGALRSKLSKQGGHSRRLEAAQKLADELMKSDKLQQIVAHTQEKKALANSMLMQLDDPDSGLNEASTKDWREKLMRIIGDDMEGDEAAGVFRSMTDAILTNSTSEHALTRFASRQREFADIGIIMRPPSGAPFTRSRTSGKAFNNIPDAAGLTPAAQKLYGQYKNLFSDIQNVRGTVQFQGIRMPSLRGGMVTQNYAQVTGPGGGFWGTIPLDTGGAGYALFGQTLQTPYAVDTWYADASKVSAHISSFGKSGFLPAQGYAEHAVGMMASRARPEGMNRRWFKGAITGIKDITSGTLSRNALVGNDAYSQHVRRQAAIHGSTLAFTGAQRVEGGPVALLKQAVTLPWVDAELNADRYVARNLAGGEQVARIGMLSGREYSSGRGMLAMDPRFITGDNAGNLPLTARVSQALGRADMISSNTSIAPAITWDSSVTGMANRLQLTQFGKGVGGLREGLKGQGQAFSVGTFSTTHDFTAKVLNPVYMKDGNPVVKYAESPMLRKIIDASNNGGWANFTREEAFALKNVIGISDTGIRLANLPSDATGVMFRIDTTSHQGDAAAGRLHIAGRLMRDELSPKLFGPQGKVTTLPLSAARGKTTLRETRGKFGVGNVFMDAIGHNNQYMIGVSDMIKKAPAFMANQVANSAYLFTNTNLYQDEGYDSLLSYAKNYGLKQNVIGAHVGGTLNAFETKIAGIMGGTGANREKDLQKIARELGYSMAGVYTSGTNAGPSAERFYNEQARLSRSNLTYAMRDVFGSLQADEAKRMHRIAMQSASSGQQLAPAAFAKGAGQGDILGGRGSVEPRFFQMLQQRLNQMGMNNKDSQSIMVDILSRKAGVGAHMQSTKFLANMMRSVVGGGNLVHGLKQSDMRHVGLQEFNSILATHGNFSSFLKQTPGGVMLDIGAGAATNAHRLIAAGGAEAMGGSGQIFFPSGEALQHIRGTIIKGAEGSQEVGSRFERSVDDFARGLLKLGSGRVADTSGAKALFGGFREEVTDLFTGSLHDITRGKIAGTSLGVGSAYELGAGQSVLSAKQKARARGMFQRTRGMSVFVDADLFVNTMADYKRAGRGVTETAQYLQNFFLSPHRAVADVKGVTAIATRHPELSLGHVAPSEIFRSFESDNHFQGWMKTESGRQARTQLETSLGGKVRNWADLASVKNKAGLQAVGSFFTQMTENLDDFMGGAVGGGGVHIPVWNASVSGYDFDMGFAGAAIGDMDGDLYMLMPMSQKSGDKISRTFEKNPSYAATDMRYKINSSVFAAEAKAGMQNLRQQLEDRGTLTNRTVTEVIQEDIMKEVSIKEGTPKVDVKLNQARMAIMLSAESNPELANESLALFKALEEHSTIKGKHLPIYQPFADMLSAGVTHAFETGKVGQLEAMLQSTFMPNSPLWDEGIQYSGSAVTGIGNADKILTDAMSGVGNQTIKMGPILQFLEESIQSYRSMSGGKPPPSSPGQMRAMLAQKHGANAADNLEHLLTYQRSGLAQSAILDAFDDDHLRKAFNLAGQSYQQILGAGSIFNRRVMGPAAVGAAGAMMLSGMVGGDSYSPTPLLMPGENLTPRIATDISGQRAMQSGVQSAPRDYPQVQNPINTGTTYVNKPSAYNVRGELTSAYGLSNLNNYMNRFGGGRASASVTITDDRRPLTSSYMDRVTGEY